MSNIQTYDDLAEHYHLIFEDWEVSIGRQAAVLSSILQNCGIAKSARVLDCACGIGTQSLGLAKLGFRVCGCDISPNAIKRAQREATKRNLNIQFSVGNMLELNDLQDTQFDAVICMDNSLPHFQGPEQVVQAAQRMRAKLVPGGTLMASIRDYDCLVEEKPANQAASFFGNQENRRIVFQVWDWLDDRRYVFHLYITQETVDGWQTFHTSGLYRAIRRDELSAALRDAGFGHVRWLSTQESGFYQPLVLAAAN